MTIPEQLPASLTKRALAEALGTFWLVLCGCGAAVIAATFPPGGIGLVGVSLAFGLSVLTMAYAIGPISGAHLNPAVTLGLVVAKRFPSKELATYWIAQVFGAIIAAGVLYLIATGAPGFIPGGFAANGYGPRSPGLYPLGSALLTELIMTAVFVLVILGATEKDAPKGFAPLAIGLCLTLIHLVTIPVTNTSVNPARSTGPALIAGGAAISQLWLFWLAPLAGAALGGGVSAWLSDATRVAPEQRPSTPASSASARTTAAARGPVSSRLSSNPSG